jgi:hypothetical protein
MMKKSDDRAFSLWVQRQMLLVVPVKMFTHKFKTDKDESVFYEIVCHNACLRSESEDVKKAYKELRGMSKLRANLYMAQADIEKNF